MKYEVVGFYPVTEFNYNPKASDLLGTVHLYVCDIGMDIRGIRVTKCGKNIFFKIPHIFTFDHETGEKAKYPVIRWTDQAHQKEMIDFLHKNVKSEVLKVIPTLKGVRDAYNRSPRGKQNPARPKTPWIQKKSTEPKKMGNFHSDIKEFLKQRSA